MQYIPGKDNIPADVLSRYGRESPLPDFEPVYDTTDVSLKPVFDDWFRVFAPHLSLERCALAARRSLQA